MEAARRFHAALFSIYDGLLGDALRSFFSGGEKIFVDVIIQFLEEDPIFFRSGYLKERIAQRLKRTELSDRQRRRLANVCLNLS